jgi:LmbE family N-acetylglucosaminyl deacetylase
MAKTIVFSPHLDDAALSCANYCLKKKQLGEDIFIITIFSSFGNEVEIEKMRKDEDAKAMKKLGFDAISLDFNDICFREKSFWSDGSQKKRGLVRKNKIQKRNFVDKIINKVSRSLSISKADTVLSPYGLGGHPDHILTREVAELMIEKEQRAPLYYLDQPYSLHPSKWTFCEFAEIVMAPKELVFSTKEKRRALRCYSSQLEGLFKRSFTFYLYPELIFNLKVNTNHREL